MLRKAKLNDLEAKMLIIKDAKASLNQLGINMWSENYPNKQEIIDDIKNENAYVYCINNKVVATFSLFYGEDPIYEKIKSGTWSSNQPYGIIKRIAIAHEERGKNIFGEIIENIALISIVKGFSSLRLDTHPDNQMMRGALEKNGFHFVGELHTDQIWSAYELVLTDYPTRLQKASLSDIPLIMRTIDDAKENLKKAGIDQWQTGYPNEETAKKDILNENSYLYYENNEFVGVVALLFGEDPLYKEIEDGAWKTEMPYCSIHRVAVAQGHLGKGIMGRIFEHTQTIATANNYHSIRIDTHPDNKSMQRALEKASFKYCGHIYLDNGGLRYAYEKPFNIESINFLLDV